MTKTKNINLSTTEFPTVTSLHNLEVGKIYKTTTYDIFTPLMFNRGVAGGIIPTKVNKIISMIINSLFYMFVVHVEINLKGQIIDGHHRYMALLRQGLPINFIINSQPQFNCDDPSEILNNVSEYNEINSSWSDKDAYMSALGFNEPAAMAIFNLKKYIDNNGVDSNAFTPARVIALVTKFKKGLAGNKQKRAVYCNDKHADVINSDMFLTEIDQIIELIKFLDGKGVTPWFFVRAIMPLEWSGEFSFKNTFELLKKDNLITLKTNHKQKTITTKNVENYIKDLIFDYHLEEKVNRKNK